MKLLDQKSSKGPSLSKKPRGLRPKNIRALWYRIIRSSLGISDWNISKKKDTRQLIKKGIWCSPAYAKVSWSGVWRVAQSVRQVGGLYLRRRMWKDEKPYEHSDVGVLNLSCSGVGASPDQSDKLVGWSDVGYLTSKMAAQREVFPRLGATQLIAVSCGFPEFNYTYLIK
jgi:hypothetical protein